MNLSKKNINHILLITFLIINFVSFGCSNSSSTSSGSSSDNPNYAGCRNYATHYIAYGNGLTNGFPNIPTPIAINCHFDKETLQFICHANYIDQNSEEAIQTKTWLYESVSDFIEESKSVGKKFYISCEVNDSGFGPNIIPGERISVINTFNDQDLIISSESTSSFPYLSKIYNEWDSIGRPTKTEPTGICTNDEGGSFEYDDLMRIVTENFNSRTSTIPPDGSIPCIHYYTEIEYDENGNVIMDNNNGLKVFYEMIETENICNPSRR